MANWWESELDLDQTVIVEYYSTDSEGWNECCAKVLEVFGLPGDRFYFRPGEHHMHFYFKNKKDAKVCRLLLSERL